MTACSVLMSGCFSETSGMDGQGEVACGLHGTMDVGFLLLLLKWETVAVLF
jgi:hypothetical protein